MLPHFHILYGFIFSLALYFLLKLDPFGFFILFSSTWVFDIDHYLLFILKTKSLNLFHAYKYFVERKKRREKLSKNQKKRLMLKNNEIFIFHNVEIIFCIFLLFFLLLEFLKIKKIYSFLFLIGIVFHILLDLVQGLREGLFKERFSLILFFIEKRRLKN
jgi:hypothetical protein